MNDHAPIYGSVGLSIPPLYDYDMMGWKCMKDECDVLFMHTPMLKEVHKHIPIVHVYLYLSDALLVLCGRMSQENVATIAAAAEPAIYKCCHKPLSLVNVIVTKSISALTILNRTPAEIPMSIMGESIRGCYLEPLRPLEKGSPDHKEGQLDCLIATFLRDPFLRWDEKKVPVFTGERRYMRFRTRKMLTYVLQSPFCFERLTRAGIWGESMPPYSNTR